MLPTEYFAELDELGDLLDHDMINIDQYVTACEHLVERFAASGGTQGA